MRLTLDFYRRNYIEGLFLSSGIIRRPNYTMEQIVEVARLLREDHDFRGYIHLKTIPDADPELVAAGGALRRPAVDQRRAADARAASTRLAPEKDAGRSKARWRDMKALRSTTATTREKRQVRAEIRAGGPDRRR